MAGAAGISLPLNFRPRNNLAGTPAPFGPLMPNYTDYTVSIHYDRRLYHHDIAGSIAHARMLARQDGGEEVFWQREP